MKDNNFEVNSPSDNLAFKDEGEKQECLDEIRKLKLRVINQIGLFILIPMLLFGIGAIVYLYFTYF